MKVITGNLYMTRGVNDAIADSAAFSKEVTDALKKYVIGDWGDCCAEDKALNDAAQSCGDRIVAKYNTSIEPIFIITEADKSATTVLFCSEY